VRAARVWKAVLGVQHTVIEGVALEQAGAEEVLVARVRRVGRDKAAAGAAPGAPRDMTPVEDGAAGGAWTWAPCGCIWRPTRRGWTAPNMG
jgi:hypothetical protein